MSKPYFSIVIPNWNGEGFLPRCLTTLISSARKTGQKFEIIVVDDASEDSSRDLLRERFRSVILLENSVNLGFARSVNRGAKAAKGEILILCNNDLAATPDFIPNLIRWFQKDQKLPKGVEMPLFGVSAKTVAWYDGKPNQLCMGGIWRGGRLSPAWSEPKAPSPCLFVQAGAAAYHRRLFWELGGLSMLYEPAYWEDYDLSYRAAMLGWGNLYDPTAVAIHHGGGSMIKRFGQKRVDVMRARNHLLFEMARLAELPKILEWGLRLSWQLAKEFPLDKQAKRLTPAFRLALPLLVSAQKSRFKHRARVRESAILLPFKDFSPSD